jgi:dGTPase
MTASADYRRAEHWASTMHGTKAPAAKAPGTPASGATLGGIVPDDAAAHSEVVLAHSDSAPELGDVRPFTRTEREAREEAFLCAAATRSEGGGNRPVEEEPDPERTCFERDRDRILHGTTAFRRLAGKTQVFVFPDDHQRTRLTHALEVAQVATSIARSLRLNVALTEAIALGHDCGHGPGGHASEDAFTPYLDEGYDHAVWGADVVLAGLNLCRETTDGIRNHSWSRPAPGTPEGEVVSWADRIAYVCHDFEDAVLTGIVTPAMLPPLVLEHCGATRKAQLNAFITAMVRTAAEYGVVGMDSTTAEALAAFRRFNYDHIYMRPASVAQAESVITVLRALVEFYADRPNTLPLELIDPGHHPVSLDLDAGSPAAIRESVTYVAGMTDRYAFQSAIVHLGWDRNRLPAGVDFQT